MLCQVFFSHFRTKLVQNEPNSVDLVMHSDLFLWFASLGKTDLTQAAGPMYRIKHCRTQRERDLHVIEGLVRRFGSLSQVEIHELTNLQRSAVSGLVRDLLTQGRLVEAGRSDNSLGRKRILLRLNEEHGFFLGVGFDDEAVLAAVMDLRPRIHSIVREATRLEGGINGLAHQLLSCAHEAVKQAGLQAESILGIGLAGSGLVNSKEGTMVMSSTIESLKQVPLRRISEKECSVSVLQANC